LNSKGEIIGINTFKIEPSIYDQIFNGSNDVDGISLAISSESVKVFLEKNEPSVWEENRLINVTEEPLEPSKNNSTDVKEKLPAWVIVLIILGGLLLIFTILFIILYRHSKYRATHSGVSHGQRATNGLNNTIGPGYRKLGEMNIERYSAPVPPTYARKGSMIIRNGSMRGISVSIYNNETISVGRDSKQAQLTLSANYTGISRLHCTVGYDSEKNNYIVTDLSINGTYIDGNMRIDRDRPIIVAAGTIIVLAGNSCAILLQ
jgi:hypothetical protein